MSFRIPSLVALTALWLTPSIFADPPQINDLRPAGIPRGVATEVTISGGNLAANPRIVTSIPLKVEPAAMPSTEAGKWVVKLTAPADLPLGAYPFRVVTDEGISNPFLIAIGQVPNVAETEPNNNLEAAQVVPIPCAVEGQASGNDVDHFKFAGRKGQKVLIDAQCARIGSGVDPQLRVTTTARAFVASADDTPGLFTDARMIVELPEDGDYIVELSDTKYQGGGRAVYRLILGAIPAAEEVYPLGARRDETIGLELRGGSLAAQTPSVGAAWVAGDNVELASRPRITNLMIGQAGPTDPLFDIELPMPLEVSNYPEVREPLDPAAKPTRAAAPVVLNGRLDTPGDEDRFHIQCTPGQVLRVQVRAADLGSALDGSIRILNAANDQQIGNADDTNVPPNGLRGQPRKTPGTTSPDPSMDVTVPGGVTEIAVLIRDLAGHGGLGYPYRIVVEPADPTVYAQLAGDAQISIPKGGTAVVPVNIARQGFNGPFTINVTNAPPGLSVRPAQVAAGAVIGNLSLTAAPDAAFGPIVLDLVASSPAPNPLSEKVGKMVVFAQQQNLPSYAIEEEGLHLATAPARVLSLDSPAEAIEAVHGFSAVVPIKVARSGDPAKGELTIPVVQPLPQGLGMGETKIAADAAEGAVTVTIDPATPVGPVTLGFTAKGKFENKDQVFGIPAATLNVVRPVDIEPAVLKIETKPGQTFELKGKLTRRGPFKQPVTIQLSGLPEGLKCEPATVAPEAAEFSLKIIADEKANAAEVKCQLAIATFKLNDKDYNPPAIAIDLKVVK